VSPWTFLFCGSSRREFLFEGRGTDGDAIELNGSAGRVTGDLEFVGKDRRWAGEKKQGNAEREFRVASHMRTSPGG